MKNKGTMKVSELNAYISKHISMDYILADVKVEGEISNFVHHNSGHMYFSLKDKNAKIKAIMYKWYNKKLNFVPEIGKKVVAKGSVSIYEKEGDLQLCIDSMEEYGLGDLHEKYLKLMEKLKGEGLFDDKHKKPIPTFPRKIGIVTAATGAAIRDIINIVKRRDRTVEMILYPSLVQGELAPENIIKGIEYLDTVEDIDCIIIGRGGGSFEELFAFNDEKLAYTIFNAKKPIVSAVGHEIDFSISDFVADLRASTPSAAAELLVPNSEDLRKSLSLNRNNLRLKINKILEIEKLKLRGIYEKIGRYNKEVYVDDLIKSLNSMKLKLHKCLINRIDRERLNLNAASKTFVIINLGEKHKSFYKELLISKQRLKESLNRKIANCHIELMNIFIRSEAIKQKLYFIEVKDSEGKNVYSIDSIKVNQALNLMFVNGEAVVKVEKIMGRNN